jgi:hypothetical protein
MKLYQLKPMTVVDYQREVFIYEYGNVRVTFDSCIKTSFRNNDLLNPDLAMVETTPNVVVQAAIQNINTAECLVNSHINGGFTNGKFKSQGYFQIKFFRKNK